MEGIRKDPAFSSLTWFWGPELYRRNRVVFREIILNHFSDFERGFWGGKRIRWKTHADRLDAWLAAAREHRDIAITRRLLTWKFANDRWGIAEEPWCKALTADYRAAASPAAQAAVLDEFDAWFRLDEKTANELYRINPICSKFILKHLPFQFSFWGNEQRQPWREMIRMAEEAGDDELAFTLYRRQVDAKEWQRDIVRLAQEIVDPASLHDELKKRHPDGYGLKTG